MNDRCEINVMLDQSDLAYFDSCARIRDVTVRSLFRRLLTIIARDTLVPSVLDDDKELRRRYKGEHRYKEKKS